MVETSEAIVTPEVETERPKSPWTPSYTVTTQGPGAADDSKELAELESLEPQAEVVVDTEEAVAVAAASVAVTSVVAAEVRFIHLSLVDSFLRHLSSGR